MKTLPLTKFADQTGIPFESKVDRTQGSSSKLSIRFLGTAGFIVESADRTIVLDPYVSRPGLWDHLVGPLRPNRDLILNIIPRCDDVLIGHSHSDHLLDAPTLAIEYGARIIGTETTSAIAKAAARHAGNVEIETLVTQGGEDIACGTAIVRGVPSFHAPIAPHLSIGKYLGDGVPFPGTILEEEGETLEWPLRASQFKEGGVLDWLISISGLRILHIDSAKFDRIELERLDVEKVDVLCLCAIGWQKGNPDYVPYLLERFQPRYIVPCHWDNFFDPYRSATREARVWGISRLDSFIEAIQDHATKSELILLQLDGVIKL
ncbi:MAG: MBL fold metallo-hydrolase [Verrucomicrobiales bacterium]|nr:MBL fold metallo-hydrolase [Verrucomicrobiales bacterium]